LQQAVQHRQIGSHSRTNVAGQCLTRQPACSRVSQQTRAELSPLACLPLDLLLAPGARSASNHARAAGVDATKCDKMQGSAGVHPLNCRPQVVVHNLPWTCSWQQLKDAFVEAGVANIERADVIIDSSGRSRCP